MVHGFLERSTSTASYQETLNGQQRPSRRRYVFVPNKLLLNYTHKPLLVGLYVAIGRLALVAKRAVPASSTDLARWVGGDRDAAIRAAILRGIQTLIADGWLIKTEGAGNKLWLLPTWGHDEAGHPQPWRFDRTTPSKRPACVRVPLPLLDYYLGKLTPQPSGEARIERYFDRALLDYEDLGVYALGMQFERPMSARLDQLGLRVVAGASPPDPPDLLDMLTQSAAGSVTIREGDDVIVVRLSRQGITRLRLAQQAVGSAPSDAGVSDDSSYAPETNSHGCADGSALDPSDTRDGSADGSALDPSQREETASGWAQLPLPHARIDDAWSHRDSNESINQESIPNSTTSARESAGGGSNSGTDRDRAPGCQSADAAAAEATDQRAGDCENYHSLVPALDPLIVEGHRALNPERTIPPGEWWELLDLQRQHGAAWVLRWQARAQRAPRDPERGIIPAYYHACAAGESLASYQARPRSADPQAADDQPAAALDPTPDSPPSPAPTRRVALPAPVVRQPPDAARAAILDHIAQLMDEPIVERDTLGVTPLVILEAWEAVIAHPGLAARFTSPLGFFVRQAQRSYPPPPAQVLSRWAEQRPPGRLTSEAIAHYLSDPCYNGLFRAGSDMDGCGLDSQQNDQGEARTARLGDRTVLDSGSSRGAAKHVECHTIGPPGQVGADDEGSQDQWDIALQHARTLAPDDVSDEELEMMAAQLLDSARDDAVIDWLSERRAWRRHCVAPPGAAPGDLTAEIRRDLLTQVNQRPWSYHD